MAVRICGRGVWTSIALNSSVLTALVQIVESADPSVNITIRRFTHSFPQKSLIVRLESAADGASTFISANEDANEFEGANEFKDAHNAEDPRLIIIGAHQDSLNYKLPFYRAPGADDDGSGTVALLQILRTLVGKVSIFPGRVPSLLLAPPTALHASYSFALMRA